MAHDCVNCTDYKCPCRYDLHWQPYKNDRQQDLLGMRIAELGQATSRYFNDRISAHANAHVQNRHQRFQGKAGLWWCTLHMQEAGRRSGLLLLSWDKIESHNLDFISASSQIHQSPIVAHLL